MRLFIAINFSEDVKEKLCIYQSRLKNIALKGNFTKKENLHITLIFLGEVLKERVDIITQVMDSLDASEFSLLIGDIGCFKRDDGDICWVGVEQNKELENIFDYFASSLLSCGFYIDNRKYKPHLTLARKVKLSHNNYIEQLDELPLINTKINKISLMESKQIHGVLTYKEIYCKNLK